MRKTVLRLRAAGRVPKSRDDDHQSLRSCRAVVQCRPPCASLLNDRSRWRSACDCRLQVAANLPDKEPIDAADATATAAAITVMRRWQRDAAHTHTTRRRHTTTRPRRAECAIEKVLAD